MTMVYRLPFTFIATDGVSCLGEVAAELQMIQRGGVDSDDEGDGAASDGEEEGEEAEEAEDED